MIVLVVSWVLRAHESLVNLWSRVGRSPWLYKECTPPYMRTTRGLPWWRQRSMQCHRYSLSRPHQVCHLCPMRERHGARAFIPSRQSLRLLLLLPDETVRWRHTQHSPFASSQDRKPDSWCLKLAKSHWCQTSGGTSLRLASRLMCSLVSTPTALKIADILLPCRTVLMQTSDAASPASTLLPKRLWSRFALLCRFA